MIVFDASTLVGAALKPDSVPEQALLKARSRDTLAWSLGVDAELIEVLGRPKFALALSEERRLSFLRSLRDDALWFAPSIRVTDCRDAKDNKYLELAIESEAGIIVSSDLDLLVLDPWRGIRIVRPRHYLEDH